MYDSSRFFHGTFIKNRDIVSMVIAFYKGNFREHMIKFHIGRCHPLTNNRKGQYAVDLVHPYRMIFEKHGNKIQVAHIMEIVDYH